MSTNPPKVDEKDQGAKKANDAGTQTGQSKAAKAAKPRAAKATRKGGGHKKRLRPGELDGLVLTYMHENEKNLPISPTAVASGIQRSSGAVANCLERLAKSNKARLAEKAPRKYDLKEVKAR